MDTQLFEFKRNMLLSILILVFSGIILFTAYKMNIEPYRLMITEKEILSDNLTDKLQGLRIAHLADFHFDKNHGKHIIDFFDLMHDRKIDLIFLTGDFVETKGGLDNLVKVLKKIETLEPRYGIYGCLGNHDYFHFSRKDFILVRYVVDEKNDIDELTKTLKENGIELLLNENRVIDINGEKVNIVGIDEYVSGRFSLPAAMDGLDPNRFTILISHAPDIVFHLEPYKVDLVLSGHTHGGQIKLPFWGTVIKRTKLKRKQSSGLFRYNGTNVHITQGLGASPKAMVRFLCSPEIAMLTLNKKSKIMELPFMVTA